MPSVDTETIVGNDVNIADTTVSHFSTVTESDQCSQLKIYLLSLGADVNEEVTDDLKTDLEEILGGVTTLLESQVDAEEIRGALYSICSLVMKARLESVANFIPKFCALLESTGKQDNASIRLEILNTLIYYELTSPSERYQLYMASLNLAKQYKLVDRVTTDLQLVSKWLDSWKVTCEERINTYRLIHDLYIDNQQNDEAATVMLELLRVYDDSNVTESREDAKKCIIDTLKNPDVYLYDHLFLLKPVTDLQGDLIYDLLNIFVTEDLHSYMRFYEKHEDFVKSIGLSQEENLRKMRLLSLTSFVSKAGDEVNFSDLVAALSISEDDLEQYVIDAISCKLISAKIDERNQKLIVKWAKNRTFNVAELKQVSDRLCKWKDNLQMISKNLSSVAQAL